MNAPSSKIEPETLLGALAAVLPKLEAAKKNSNNPHFKAKYADLGSVLEAIQPIAEHGLWFRQVSHEADNGVCIETFYIHASGELSAGKVFVPADKNNAQGFGSAQTYARRYGLQMAFGLATEDDDGNAASAPRQHGGSGEEQNGGRAASPTGTAKRPQGGMPEAEYAKIAQLIEATKTVVGPMLKHFGVESLRQLNQTQYSEAVQHLNNKLATMAKEETNKAASGFGEILDDEIPY